MLVHSDDAAGLQFLLSSAYVSIHSCPVPFEDKCCAILSRASLSLGNSGYSRSPTPVASGPAVDLGQLDSKVAEIVPVVSSSATVIFPISSPA